MILLNRTHLLFNMNILIAHSKGTQAVKCCSNKMFHFLTGVLVNTGRPM